MHSRFRLGGRHTWTDAEQFWFALAFVVVCLLGTAVGLAAWADILCLIGIVAGVLVAVRSGYRYVRSPR